MTENCKFCGQHPYEYIDVVKGAAKPEVVCCDAAQSAVAMPSSTDGARDYREDVKRRPTYPDGRPRKDWKDLPEIARWSWERTPVAREAMEAREAK